MTWRAWTTFAILCVIWGVPYLLIKFALVDLSPACIAWTRLALAAFVLLPIAWKRGVLRPALKHKVAITVFAVTELVIPFSLIAVGEQWLSSSLTGILIATAPMAVVLIAPWFGIKETMGALRWLGLGIGFLGVVVLLGIDTGQVENLWLGVACVIGAVAGYAVGPLVVERYLGEVDELGALAASLAIAAALFLPVAAFTAPSQMPSASALISVAVLGAICTALALLLYFQLINEAGAARATLVAYINPAVAALLGVAILDEPFGLGSAAGLAMILVGSWFATGKAQRPAE
jgi:drug/metabolite transporter (DMT)-like permease